MIERLAAVILTLLVTSGSPGAQEYPSRLIRVVVGPGPDIVARLFAPRMSEALGQQVVIEPRPGAGDVIAAQTIATAQPDGYNLLLATASYTINTALKTSPYDMRRDFSPTGQVGLRYRAYVGNEPRRFERRHPEATDGAGFNLRLCGGGDRDICTLPPTTALSAELASRNGTWTMSMPAIALNNSPARCGGVPMPDDA